MGNSQIPFTQLPNYILEALMRTSLSGQELRIVLLLIRKTYGFHKDADYISNSQMRKFTGIDSKSRISQLINGLVEKSIIIRFDNSTGRTKKYALNKHYSEWEGYCQPEAKETTSLKKAKKEFMKNETRVYKNLNHKRNNTKETTTKEKGKVDSMFKEFWDAYPKSKNKEGAWQQFKKLNPDEDQFKSIVNALERFKKTKQWQKANGKYVPYAINWLKDKRYDDEIQENELVKDQKAYGISNEYKKGY
jgi:phage replication O-like protein O